MNKVILMFGFFFCSFAYAESWKEMRSDHFTIIYDAKQRQLASHYLSLAEKVYEELVPVFKEAPHTTYLVLVDYFDYSNGAATVIPWPTIYLYPHLPNAHDTIEYHSSWAYLLLKHEFTHILNMYPANGAFKYLNYIFGAWARPNWLLPRWYMEGLAVERESEGTTRFGRINSPYYQGLLRSYVLQEQLQEESIDRLNSFSVPQYPYGSRPYFLGAFFWHYLEKTYGEDLIYSLNDDYSRRMPWWIEAPIQRHTGKTYDENLHDAYQFYRAKTESEIQKLGTSFTEPENILKGFFQRNLRFHPIRNQALYLTTNAYDETDLWLLTFANPDDVFTSIEEQKKLLSSDKIIRAEWNHDGTKILYDTLSSYKGKYTYFDLREYELATKEKIKLTDGERARDASYIDENNIVFVDYEASVFSLKLWNRDTKTITSLVEGDLEEHFSSPLAFNNTIYFIRKKPNGEHSIETSDGKVLYTTPYTIHSLTICENNLCWIDDSNGVANFVQWSFAARAKQAYSNSATAIIDGQIYKNRIYLSELNKDGSFYRSDENKQAVKLESIRPSLVTAKDMEVRLLDVKERNYSSTLHLYPRFWFPFISADESGTYYTIQTMATDPANLQNYSIYLGYYTANQKWDKVFNYQNIYWDILLNLYAEQSYDYLESIDTNIEHNHFRFTVGLNLYWLSDDLNLLFSVEHEAAQQENFASRRAQGAKLEFIYDKTKSIPHGGIVPENGFRVSLSQAEYIKKKDYYDFSISEATYRHYISYFLPDHHVFHYKLAARYSEANSRPLSLGSLTLGGTEYTGGSDQFEILGYPNGNFLAWSAYLAQANYSFPLYTIFRGSSTYPYFLKQLSGNLLAQTLWMDGAYYDENSSLRLVDTDKSFSTFGLEAKLSTEVFYVLPIDWVLGYYFGTTKDAGGDDRFYLRLESVF